MAEATKVPVRCPRCGEPPTFYVDSSFAEFLAVMSERFRIVAHQRTISERCTGCGRIYPVPINALALDEPVH